MTKLETERLAIVETQIKDMGQRMDRQFGENAETNRRIESKLDDFISCADKKFAPAWVAWFIKLWIGGLLTSAIGLLVYLIQKHII
jgi:hypothetical protein